MERVRTTIKKTRFFTRRNHTPPVDLTKESLPLPQKLTLVDLFPNTYRVGLEKQDIGPYAKAVTQRFFQKHTDGPTKKVALKSARQWAGIGLGTLAFWALPWPVLALDTSILPLTVARSVSAAMPYFVLNLPDSAKSYKTLLTFAGNAMLSTALLPISLTRYVMWRRKKSRVFRKKSEENFKQLATIYMDEPLRKVQQTARQLTRLEMKQKTEQANKKRFAASNTEVIAKLGEILPDVAENQRVRLMQEETEHGKKKGIREAALLVGATIAIPAAFFHFAVNPPGTIAEILPQTAPFIAASFASIFARRGLVRTVRSVQHVGKQYSREKIGNQLLSQLPK